jgi:hypothetical protein
MRDPLVAATCTCPFTVMPDLAVVGTARVVLKAMWCGPKLVGASPHDARVVPDPEQLVRIPAATAAGNESRRDPHPRQHDIRGIGDV